MTAALIENDESELRLIKGKYVEIDEIEVIDGMYKGKKLPLKGSLVVRV